MSLAIVNSRANSGINAKLVTLEIDLSNGLPCFSIVGLPETAVKESKDRVRSALLNTLFDFPSRRITVNLAPADLPKEGSRFDLPIALGILAATDQIPADTLATYEVAGELALSGELRPIKGILPFALATRKAGRKLIIPKENAEEAAIAGGLEIYPAEDILAICSHLNGINPIIPYVAKRSETRHVYENDISDVRGQSHAKRVLEIAAAGGHSLLMQGPPGTGKTMLASRLPTIMPEMTEDEALEAAAIASICGKSINQQNWRQRAFRNPHHTASGVALVGGGSPPKPGEISLTHHGVLFLDELPEFSRHVLETLREPIESGKVTISRAARQAEFPAKFQLIAAMNPCPCGFQTDPNNHCSCTPDQISRYKSKLSGPFLDRIDLHLEVPALPEGLLLEEITESQETSSVIRTRVEHARALQYERSGIANVDLKGKVLENVCKLEPEEIQYLKRAMKSLKLSARAYHRVLRVARTIADLDSSVSIAKKHIQEALSYRQLS